MNKKISLIIPVYNALPYLKKCLKSVIKNFSFEIGEVYLINDFSNKETSSYLEKIILKHPYINLVNNTENLGYVESCNKGVTFANGEIIVLLNSDTEIPKSFCSKIIQCFNKDKNIGTASPIASNSATHWLPQIFNIETMNKYLEKSEPNYPEIFNAEGFCICIRKNLIDKYGLYDTCFSPGYCEEVDLCLRLYSKGYRNVLIDNLYVKHARNKSFGTESRKLHLEEHNVLLYKRWKDLLSLNNDNGDIIKTIIRTKFSPYKYFIFRLMRLNKTYNNSRLLSYFRLNNYFHNTKNPKRIIYTCIVGNYDIAPILQKYLDKDAKYICFTDNLGLIKHRKIGEWEIRPLEFNKLCDTKNARWHKTHPHILFPDFEESIWIDANIEILSNKMIEYYKNSNTKILVPIHHCRNCIYKEIDAVEAFKRESEENIAHTKQMLIKNNMPEHYGLNETNIIYRKHNDTQIIKLMEEWWEIIENYSKRDQLSFSYILWKNNITPESIAVENARIDNINYKFYSHDKNSLTAKLLKKIFY